MKSKIGDLSQYRLEVETYPKSDMWRCKRWRDVKTNKVVRFELSNGWFAEYTFDENGKQTSFFTNGGVCWEITG